MLPIPRNHFAACNRCSLGLASSRGWIVVELREHSFGIVSVQQQQVMQPEAAG
jgi:hypothetical protein